MTPIKEIRSMPLVDRWRDLDTDKFAEAALGILALSHDNGGVWKGLDRDLMDLLHDRGLIVDHGTKAKSIVLTEEGERRAEDCAQRQSDLRSPSTV
jgi:hypothetical protein